MRTYGLAMEEAGRAKKEGGLWNDLFEGVISDLSKVKAIRVISRNSSMKLKGTTKDVRTIGRELNVRYVLTGLPRAASAGRACSGLSRK